MPASKQPNAAPGLTRIGSHLPSPETEEALTARLVSTPSKPNSPNSGTTGLPSPARTVSSSTGRQLGAIGSEGPLNTVPSVAVVENSLRASLTPSVSCCLSWHWTKVFTVLTGHHILSPCRDKTALEAAIVAYESSLESASEALLLKHLGTLRLLTTSRTLTAEELKASLRLYSRKMTEFPADIAVAAIRSQANLSKWWPAWAELYEQMAPATSERRLRLEALKDLDRLPYGGLEAVTEQRLSQEQRAAISDQFMDLRKKLESSR